MDAKALFALADVDDAGALIAALPDRVVRNENGESLFLYSVFRGRTKCVEALKARGGLNLHEAALAGDAARVAALLSEAPWAVDLLSPDGWTALHLAAFFGSDAVVIALLDRGADARVMGRAFEQNLAMHAAAAGGRIGREAYAILIAATGVDARQRQGYTALMIAASNGFTVGVEALLAAGADRGLALTDGKTAADIAADRGHTELAKRLR